MRIPKVYGQSKQNSCVFCSQNATAENKQGFTVCKDHVNELMPDKQCACGEWLDIKKSKWGAFFLCVNCGPKSLSKMSKLDDTESNPGYHLNKKYRPKKEITYDRGRIYTIDELEKMWD